MTSKTLHRRAGADRFGRLRRRWASAAVFFCALATPGFAADITVCNEFPRPVFMAFAWQDQNGVWISRGWRKVETRACETDPFNLSGLKLRSFYFRGETDWYGVGRGSRRKNSWGKGGKDFAVRDNVFQFANADRDRRGARFVPFSSSAKSTSGPVNVRITIDRDGKGTTQVSSTRPAPRPQEPSRPGRLEDDRSGSRR